MSRPILERLIVKLLYPLRVAVRHELKPLSDYLRDRLDDERRRIERHQDRLHEALIRHFQELEPLQDLRLATQRDATRSTAAFVLARMPRARAFDSQAQLMEHAIETACLGESDIVCEFGVWSGKSINHIASKVRCRVYGFDSFEGLPEDWRTGFHRGHFSTSALPEVAENVELVIGGFDATVPSFCARTPNRIGLIHVDCDLYSSTRSLLSMLRSRIGPGCVLVFDEYFNYAGWQEGEFRAFEEFIADSGLRFEYIGYNRLHEQVAVRILRDAEAGSHSRTKEPAA